MLFPAEEVVGSYYEGDHLGSNRVLKLERDTRFTYSLSGCMGEYERAGGSWALSGDVVTLTLDRKGAVRLNVRLIPVKWGRRHLLVDENEMPGFAANAHELRNERSDLPERGVPDFTKIVGEGTHGKRFGDPVLPKRFQVFYRKGPRTASVVRIDRDGTVLLDAGRNVGLTSGIRLIGQGWTAPEVHLATVGATTSIGRVWYPWGADALLKIGHRLSTGGEWIRPQRTGTQMYVTFEAARQAQKRPLQSR